MTENLDTISVQEYYTSVFPQKYVSQSFPVAAGLEAAEYAIQYYVADQAFTLQVTNGNQIKVVEGAVDQPLVSVTMDEAAWRESITGSVPTGDALIDPARMSAARLEKLQGLKGKFDMELSKADGNVVSSSIVFNSTPTPEVTLIMSADDYASILRGELNSQMAFMTGKLKFKGDMNLLMKLGTLM